MHRYISFSSEILLPKSPSPNSPYPNHQPPSPARSLENPQVTKVMPGRTLCLIVDPVLIRDPGCHTQTWTQAGLSDFFLGPFLWVPSWFLQGLPGAGETCKMASTQWRLIASLLKGFRIIDHRLLPIQFSPGGQSVSLPTALWPHRQLLCVILTHTTKMKSVVRDIVQKSLL